MTWLRAQTMFPKFSFLFTFLSCVALTLSPFLAVPFLGLKDDVISSWSSISLCWNSVKDSEHLYPSISRKHSGVHSDWTMSVHELIFDLITTDAIKMQDFGRVRIIHPTIIFFFTKVLVIYSIELVSDIQQSDSVTHVSILFQILFPIRLLQSIKQSPLC